MTSWRQKKGTKYDSLSVCSFFILIVSIFEQVGFVLHHIKAIVG